MYGGKLVAALDRQHSCDLFDVMQFFVHEGITSDIRSAFVVCLASHNRAIHEVLSSVPRDIGQDYERTFKGMTTLPVGLPDLLATRKRLIEELRTNLDDAERRFLLSLVSNRPEWGLLGFKQLETLPGIRWKLQNIGQLEKDNPKKFAEQINALSLCSAEIGSILISIVQRDLPAVGLTNSTDVPQLAEPSHGGNRRLESIDYFQPESSADSRQETPSPTFSSDYCLRSSTKR